MLILADYLSGSGGILVETREEERFLSHVLDGLPEGVEVSTIAAPGGIMKDARTGKVDHDHCQKDNKGEVVKDKDGNPVPDPAKCVGLTVAYKWAWSKPGRVLIVYDWHMLVNSPVHWRIFKEQLPHLRQPNDAGDGDLSSLVVFVAPVWDLQPTNPLYRGIPIRRFTPPTRAELADIASSMCNTNGEGDLIADALVGLDADTATQAAAECLAANGGKWNASYLRKSKRDMLQRAGLEFWEPVEELGGLGQLQDWAENELYPFIRDAKLRTRGILATGLPGTGKSYFGRKIAHKLGCDICRASLQALKGKNVGDSESALRRMFQTIDACSDGANLIVVFDELDCMTSRESGDPTAAPMHSMLLTWLHERKSQALVIATMNRLDKLDAAIESRFQAQFFFDLGSQVEREAVAKIHYARLDCSNVDEAARYTAAATAGFSSREIAEKACVSVARRSNRKPTAAIIEAVCKKITPASTTQVEQLEAMRKAAVSLMTANDLVEPTREPVTPIKTGRRIAAKA